MQITQGNLVMVGVNTLTPQVYFNGKQVEGVVGIRIDWEADEQRVKLKVNGTDDSTYQALLAAGIHIKMEH